MHLDAVRPRLRRLGRELSRGLLDALAPPHCPGCGAPGEALCGPCAATLAVRPRPWCPRCGAPTIAVGAPCSADHRRLRGIAIARAPLEYAGTGGALVRRLKFEHDLAAGLVLARLMAASLRDWARRDGRRAVVVSVPLHRSKLRARRFDQAAWLADAVAMRLRLRCGPRAMRRVRATLPQGDPRVMSRERNVEGAFAVRKAAVVRGRVVVLVDDVTTSGATARECARALRAAGARGVALLTAVLA